MGRKMNRVLVYILFLFLCVSMIACSKKEEQDADHKVSSSITILPSSDTKKKDINQQKESNNITPSKAVTSDDNSLPIFDGNKVKNKKAQLGNTPGNHANGGLICESDGWLYYSDYNNKGYLCRKKLNGSRKQVLVEEKCININIVNGYIYFHSQEDKANLKRCTLEGKDITSLTDDWIMDYIVTANKIYIATEYIEKMDLDGKNRTKLTTKGDYGCLNLYGDYIIYTDYTKINISAVKNDGCEQYLVKADAKGYDIYDDNLYYFDEITHYLTVLNLPNGESKQIGNGIIPNMFDETLYTNAGSAILKYDEEQNTTVDFVSLKREGKKEMLIQKFYIADGRFYILYQPDSNYYDKQNLATIDIKTGEIDLFE